MSKSINNDSLEPMPLKPHKPKRKKGKTLVGIFILLVLGGGIVGVYINRHKIAPLVKDIAVLNKIFPVQTEQVIQKTPEELEQEVAQLQANNLALQTSLEATERANVLLEDKVEALKQYETEYASFQRQKENWDAEMAALNPELFIEQYEAMYPEYAAKLYKEAVVEQQMTKEEKQFATVVGEMDPDQAAKALEKLIATDPELIQVLFNAMNDERQSLILSAMSSQAAAQVIKLISP